MIRFLRYLIRRLLLLAFIAGLTYFTVFYLFPYIDDRTPFLLAVLCTYILLAYGLIPALLRILRVFDKPNHIPTCAVTRDGWPSDPVNVAVLAESKTAFYQAMRTAGWLPADPATFKNVFHIVWAIIANQPYPTAPFSPLYLFGRRQDCGFQIAVGNSPRRRHHIRFWHVTHQSMMSHSTIERTHRGLWRTLLAELWHKKQQLWVGAAIYDSGPVDIVWRNGQLNHRVHRDADYEREFFIASLQKAGALEKIVDVQSGQPYCRWGQGGISGKIISDGYVRLCTIKRARS